MDCNNTASLDLEAAVEQHAGLVKSVALRFYRVGAEDLDDLMQIGYIGLIKAAQRFEPDRGLKFSTYAVPMIAGEIKSQLRDQGRIKVSRSLKAEASAIRRAESEFIMANGRSPRLSELSEVTGIPKERINEALSADDALKNYEEYEKTDLHEDNEDLRITEIDLYTSIGNLPETERQVILLRYYRDFTQKQVAKALGISQVQVCRIEKKTLKKLAEQV